MSFDTFIVQVDGCASNSMSDAMYAVAPLMAISLSAIESKKYREDVTDHISTSITVFIDGNKYSGSNKNANFGYLGSSIFDDRVLDVEVAETVSQATKELISSIRQGQ